MARHLLAWLVAAHIVTTLATARPLRDATAELSMADGAPLPSTGVSLHGGRLKIAAGPADLANPKKHRPFDKSIAGAEVMLGGLAMAIVAAVACYIRVTRRRTQEEPLPNKS